jgi:hypothetical protein
MSHMSSFSGFFHLTLLLSCADSAPRGLTRETQKRYKQQMKVLRRLIKAYLERTAASTCAGPVYEKKQDCQAASQEDGEPSPRRARSDKLPPMSYGISSHVLYTKS